MYLFLEPRIYHAHRTMKLVILGAGLAVIGAMFFFREKPCANFHNATLRMPTQTISVALSTTPEQQMKGLGGCTYIPKDAGMYFAFNDAQERTFWMNGMLIPIDIIWIQEGRVAGIEKHVQAVPLTTTTEQLPTYTSPTPVDAVLEIEAGMAQVYGINVGDSLTLE